MFLSKCTCIGLDRMNSGIYNFEVVYIVCFFYLQRLVFFFPEQLKYWRLDPPDCLNGCNLYLSQPIDREKGKAYNVS